MSTRPGFGTVEVGAFLHEKEGDLTIVALNPTDQEQGLSLAFRHLSGLASLTVHRTSACENSKDAGAVAVEDDKAVFPMTPQSILTFSGKMTLSKSSRSGRIARN